MERSARHARRVRAERSTRRGGRRVSGPRAPPAGPPPRPGAPAAGRRQGAGRCAAGGPTLQQSRVQRVREPGQRPQRGGERQQDLRDPDVPADQAERLGGADDLARRAGRGGAAVDELRREHVRVPGARHEHGQQQRQAGVEEPGEELLPRGVRVVPGEPGPRGVEQAADVGEPVRDDGPHQGGPVGEVPVDGAHPDTGGARDGLHRLVEAADRVQGAGGVEHALPVPCRVRPHRLRIGVVNGTGCSGSVLRWVVAGRRRRRPDAGRRAPCAP